MGDYVMLTHVEHILEVPNTRPIVPDQRTGRPMSDRRSRRDAELS